MAGTFYCQFGVGCLLCTFHGVRKMRMEDGVRSIRDGIICFNCCLHGRPSVRIRYFIYYDNDVLGYIIAVASSHLKLCSLLSIPSMNIKWSAPISLGFPGL